MSNLSGGGPMWDTLRGIHVHVKWAQGSDGRSDRKGKHNYRST